MFTNLANYGAPPCGLLCILAIARPRLEAVASGAAHGSDGGELEVMVKHRWEAGHPVGKTPGKSGGSTIENGGLMKTSAGNYREKRWFNHEA